MRTQRIGLIAVILLLFTAGLLLLSMAGATAQSLPMYANQNPGYWYELYQSEQAKANGLEQSGKTAIDGLKASLKAANDTIIRQNTVIVKLVQQRNGQADRAEKAETALAPVKAERDKLKGKTWAGQLLRKVRDGAAIVGGAVVAGVLLNAVF